MLGSRHRHVSLSRKDVPKLWQTESDNERPRQPMNPVQRPNIEYGTPLSNDRNHRQYKRPDADQAYATAHAHYQTTTTSQPIAQPMAAVAASSSSRMRTQDDPYAYLKRKTTERRSPRSSEERLYAPDQGRPSRSSTQARGPSVPQGASQSYYAQPTRDPAVSQRDRDREKAETRDRKRLEKEAARLRAEEEKMRARAYERERDRERERRREEKELRRAEREREKEQERRREEKEQERARRHKEKERAREQSRGRDINPVYPQSATAQISAAAGALRQYANSKLLTTTHRPDPIVQLQPCSAAAYWPWRQQYSTPDHD
ncbi:hypothetical protein BDW22DRAFT_1034060 [Trametopsis cervina]|nr:hypothetical protein BDW22DRAFT_1034060 [Trametopsis cervina]